MFIGQHAIQKYGACCLAAGATESLHAVPYFLHFPILLCLMCRRRLPCLCNFLPQSEQLVGIGKFEAGGVTISMWFGASPAI